MHQEYGGVVPELASRDHIRRVVPLTHQVLQEAGLEMSDIGAVAYTAGPGLAGALLVGASVAQSFAWSRHLPAIAIHHLEGHLLSPMLADPRPEFPFVALLVSGGHTQLMRVDGVGRYELLGETLDDAAGEAFDKSAKLMGLGYPGGPALARLATQGDACLLYTSTFICYLAIGLPLAVLPGYVHGQLGYGSVLAGLAISVQYVATLLSLSLIHI